ncbi:hypothetical protein FFI16_029390 [Pseudomonas sp. KBS0710]|nr:hypothetical protein FFI16_029390 [Pseudomonas sp. KBS0710]
MACRQPQACRLVCRGQPTAFDAGDSATGLTSPTIQCGSGLARECGVSFSTSVSDTPPSRASPLPH